MSGAGSPEKWAIIELMGHRQTAGRISEVEVAGVRLLQIEIPKPRLVNRLVEPPQVLDPGWAGVQAYGGAAIYCITACSEADARRFVERRHATPLPMLSAGDAPTGADVDDADEADEADDDADEPAV